MSGLSPNLVFDAGVDDGKPSNNRTADGHYIKLTRAKTPANATSDSHKTKDTKNILHDSLLFCLGMTGRLSIPSYSPYCFSIFEELAHFREPLLHEVGSLYYQLSLSPS